MGMLETYNYEQTLLQTTNEILGHDLYWGMTQRRRAYQRGVAPSRARFGIEHRQCWQSTACRCFGCRRSIASLQSELHGLIVFRCGHSFHINCLQQRNVAAKEKYAEVFCYLCQSRGADRQGPNDSTLDRMNTFSLRELEEGVVARQTTTLAVTTCAAAP